MLNLPALLEYPQAREITIGLIDGIALATILTKPHTWRAPLWCLLVCLGGYVMLALAYPALQDSSAESAYVASQNNLADHPWFGQTTLCRTWVLAGLVWSCRAFENARVRITNFRNEGRRFVISDLLILALVVALFAAGIRQTTLSQREPVFWAGMIFISVVLPGAVACLRIGLSTRRILSCTVALGGAAVVVLGLAWAESHVVQPGRILWQDALTRYAWLIAAMMLPRILFQLTFALPRNPPSQPICHEAFTPTGDRLRETAHEPPRELPGDESGGAQPPATEQTQPALRIFA